jgi:integrase
MNVYLKEIGDICNIRDTLNTHKARRTFASTITLANGVPIHVVKEMMGHRTVQQTEVYIVTEQQAIGREMQQLRDRLELQAPPPGVDLEAIARMERELSELKARISAAHY